MYVRKGTRLVAVVHGGEQEKRRRAGTENVPAIAGLGKAAELAGQELDKEIAQQARLRDKLIKGLVDNIAHIRLNGHPRKRLPNNVNVSVDFVEGESVLLNLDLEGICASTGSACSSSSLEPSHVLLSLGIPPSEPIAHSGLPWDEKTLSQTWSGCWRSCLALSPS